MDGGREGGREGGKESKGKAIVHILSLPFFLLPFIKRGRPLVARRGL
jgi:hypothetical protein